MANGTNDMVNLFHNHLHGVKVGVFALCEKSAHDFRN